MTLLDLYTTYMPGMILALTCLLLIIFSATTVFDHKSTKTLLSMLAVYNLLIFYSQSSSIAFITAFISGCLAALSFKRKHFGVYWLSCLAMITVGPATSVGMLIMLQAVPEAVGSANFTLPLPEIWTVVKPVLIPAFIWTVLIAATIKPVEIRKPLGI